MNMKQLIDTDELIGKTIKGVFDESTREMIIVFESDHFCVIHNGGYDGDNEIELSSESFNIMPNRYNFRDLFKYGMISQYVFDELDKYFKQMDIDEANEKEQTKRNEEIWKLQQLSQKYPEIVTLKPFKND